MNKFRSLLSAGLRGLRPAKRPCQPANSRPRLLTDVSVIIRHDAGTGIQRVVRAVWTNLLQQSGTSFDLVPVFASRSHGYCYARQDFLSVPAAQRRRGLPVRPVSGDRFLGLDLSAHLLPKYERQLRMWRGAGVSTHLVVYDLLPLKRPDWFTDRAVRHFNSWLQVVRNNCDQALCISDQVATDLREYLSAATARPSIGRLTLAGDLDGSSPSRGVDAETSLAIAHAKRHPTVLMVGTIEPRKGYEVALAAFEYLWQNRDEQAPALIIAGKPGWRTDALQERLRRHPQAGQRLFWLSRVSDEGLAELYKASRCLLLTSYGEGFGLPAIEAAMHGTAALVRDLPVFREQRLPNLFYFPDDTPHDLGESVMKLVQQQPILSLAQYSLPSWSDSVSDLLPQLGFGDAEENKLIASRNYAAA